MQKALENFIGTIEATGGVFIDAEGYYVPVADPEWMDLGDAYLVACEALNRKPMVVTKNDEAEAGYGPE